MPPMEERMPGVKMEVAPPPRAPRADLTAADFDWGELLGEGSYSQVVRSMLRATGDTYAMKVMDKRHIVRADKIRYVKNERYILDQLDHPGVGRLYFTFQDPTSLYMGLELCPNGELYDQIKRAGQIPHPTAVAYAAEIVETLEYMHGMGVVHRDLKPENLLLDVEGHLKLVDFGSAKALPGSPVLVITAGEDQTGGGRGGSDDDERASSFVGTAEYVAPETLAGKEATRALDLWSLGCVVYQMLHGKPPFKGESEYLTMKKVQERDFTMPEGFSPEAASLVDGLLAKDPSLRIGAGKGGWEEVKGHPFFAGVEWGSVRGKEAPDFLPPPVPILGADKGGGTPFEFMGMARALP